MRTAPRSSSSRSAWAVAGAQTSPAVPKPKDQGRSLAFIKKTGARRPTGSPRRRSTSPRRLDLSWSQPPPGSPWDPNKNVGQFIWTSINENEARWKEGIKFLHQCSR
jgi:hypothetical protein